MSRKYPATPIVGVGVVVTGHEGVLLIKRAHPPGIGTWSLPGGGQELGERIEDTARREIYEETGLNIKVLGLVDVIDSISRDDDGCVRYHYTLIDLAACVTGGELRAGDDAADARWFTLNELTELDLWSETARVIGLAIKKYG